uniref:Putative secreted protein n=1 Tax=Ixodes ricinus TaxID=34613 RepID=A0A6B0UHR7_IXORI
MFSLLRRLPFFAAALSRLLLLPASASLLRRLVPAFAVGTSRLLPLLATASPGGLAGTPPTGRALPPSTPAPVPGGPTSTPAAASAWALPVSALAP